MIKINKGQAPSKLTKDDLRLTKKNKVDFDNGIRIFKIADNYKSDDVKKALKHCHHNKCCFSEAKYNGDYFNVEHFRPKGAFDNWYCSKSVHSPGYYWLAYSWSNLFLAKTRVNTSYKGISFPLFDEAKRNRSHHDKNDEPQILIDPSIEDPRAHIRFENDEPIGITSRGLFNIIFLGLRDDEDLVEDRRTRLEFLRRIKDSVDLLISVGLPLDNPVVAANIATLKKAVLPSAAFSSMAIDFLSGWRYMQ